MIGGCHQNSVWIEKILLLIAGDDFSENPQMLIDLKKKFEDKIYSIRYYSYLINKEK